MKTANDPHKGEWTAQISRWTAGVSVLAAQVGCEQAVRPALDRAAEAQRETINIAIVGGVNSGKSSRINALLERKILPVSMLASNCAFAIQPTRGGESEQFSGSGTSGPLDNLASAIEASTASSKEYQIIVDSEWLRGRSLQLSEKPALDATDEEIEALIEECLQGTDLIVLLIDALMPIRRSEHRFLNSCVQRTLPVVIAISKTDKLPDEEREIVRSYITQHVASCQTVIPTCDTCVTSELNKGMADLKQTIEERLANLDLPTGRRAEARHALQAAINMIAAAVQVAAEAQRRSQEELNRDIRQRQQQIDGMKLEWMKLGQEMVQKRQRIEAQLRTFLEENQKTVFEGVLGDLEQNNDIKSWWQHDLPFRLQRELQSLGGQLAASINKNISDDIKWLREELLRCVNFPLHLLTEATVQLCEPSSIQGEQKKLPLSDNHVFKVVSRFGTAASAILAGSLLVTAGIGGIGLAASVVLAGLTAEQIVLYNARKDRHVVQFELQKLIQQAVNEYVADVSCKLKQGYDEILANLKQHQEQWQQAQLDALQAYTQNRQAAGGFDAQEILRRLQVLKNEIAVE